MAIDDVDGQAQRLGATRAQCWPNPKPQHNLSGRGAVANHTQGAFGEIAVARALGLPMPRNRPHGDGGVDFEVCIHGVRMTIDVKTTDAPNRLLMIPIHDIAKPTSVYVLVQNLYGTPRLLGWEHRSIMLCMPTRDFGKGVLTHFRHYSQLRPIAQLVELLAMRDTAPEQKGDGL